MLDFGKNIIQLWVMSSPDHEVGCSDSSGPENSYGVKNILSSGLPQALKKSDNAGKS